MGRRDGIILDDLINLSWWLSVAGTVAAFILLRFIVPVFMLAGPLTGSNYALKGILGGLSTATPLVAIFLLIPDPGTAFRLRRQRRLLDSQNGPATSQALSSQRFETPVGEAYRRQGFAVSRLLGDGGPDGGVGLTSRETAPPSSCSASSGKRGRWVYRLSARCSV